MYRKITIICFILQFSGLYYGPKSVKTEVEVGKGHMFDPSLKMQCQIGQIIYLFFNVQYHNKGLKRLRLSKISHIGVIIDLNLST